MRTYIAVTTLITMLAASAAFARAPAAVPIGVDQTAAYGSPADDGIHAAWAAQYATDRKTSSLMQTSATASAGVVLTASQRGGAMPGRGGGAMQGGFSGHSGRGHSPMQGGFSGRSHSGHSFHTRPFVNRSFDRDRFMHRDFNRNQSFHRDFNRDRFHHRNFDHYPYRPYYSYPYRYYYPYTYYYPYGYYPYGYYPYGYYYYYGNPWYFYPYFYFSW